MKRESEELKDAPECEQSAQRWEASIESMEPIELRVNIQKGVCICALVVSIYSPKDIVNIRTLRGFDNTMGIVAHWLEENDVEPEIDHIVWEHYACKMDEFEGWSEHELNTFMNSSDYCL